MTTIIWQRIEGGLVFVTALLLAVVISPDWQLWIWPLVLLAPDLSMTGYLVSPRIGAIVYNAFHLYACGLLLALSGLFFGHPGLIAAGALWLAHVGIDRAIGYGLKETAGFHDTHLGRIGKGG